MARLLRGSRTTTSGIVAPGADGQVLTSTGAVWQSEAAAGGNNLPYFQAYMSANQSVADQTSTVIAFDLETFDSAGAFDIGTYRFTPLTAGHYYLYLKEEFQHTGQPTTSYAKTNIRKNGTGFIQWYWFNTAESGSIHTHQAYSIVEANGSSDYFDCLHFHHIGSTLIIYGCNAHTTIFGGFKLIT